MARTLVRDGVLHPFERGGGGLMDTPKHATKASMIVHLVHFDKQHTSRPLCFCPPSVEDLAFLVQIHHMQRL